MICYFFSAVRISVSISFRYFCLTFDLKPTLFMSFFLFNFLALNFTIYVQLFKLTKNVLNMFSIRLDLTDFHYIKHSTSIEVYKSFKHFCT